MARSLRRGKFGAHSINQAIGANQCTFTIGTEAADVINVAGQLTDGNGNALAEVQVIDILLSDAATGIGITAAAPSGGITAGTDGKILVADVANKLVRIQTTATGAFDIDLTEVGVATWYAVAIIKGDQSVSGVITFA